MRGVRWRTPAEARQSLGMASLGVDSLLPPSLRSGPPEERRRARLIVYALGIALGADLITALFMPAVAWKAHRGLWLAAHLASHPLSP